MHINFVIGWFNFGNIGDGDYDHHSDHHHHPLPTLVHLFVVYLVTH